VSQLAEMRQFIHLRTPAFLRTMKFCQTHRCTNAKASTWPTLQSLTFHLPPY